MKGGTIRPITFDKLKQWRKLTCNTGYDCGFNVAHFLGLIVDSYRANELAKHYSRGIPGTVFKDEVDKVTGISHEYVPIKIRGSSGRVDILDYYLRPNQGVAMYVYYKKGCNIPAHLTILYRTPFEGDENEYVILDPQQEKIYHLKSFLQLNAEAAFILVPVKEQLDKWRERYVDTHIFQTSETASIRIFLSGIKILPGITGCNIIGRPYGPQLKFEKANPKVNPSLAILKNCGVSDRWSKWMIQPSPLRFNINLGCGLNVLYFLSLISYEQADVEFDKLTDPSCSVKGTPLSMIANAIRVEGMRAVVKRFNFELKDDISMFFNKMYHVLPDNACTIVRYERSGDAVGHTVIMSKKDGVLHTIDPQQILIRPYKGFVSDKMVTAMNTAGFISVSIIMLETRMDLEIEEDGAGMDLETEEEEY